MKYNGLGSCLRWSNLNDVKSMSNSIDEDLINLVHFRKENGK